MISSLRPDAVVLNVAAMEACTAFYRDVVGMTPGSAAGGVTTLGTPARTLVELRHHPQGRVFPAAPGLFHMAIRLPSRADLARWFLAFSRGPAARHASFGGASDHGVSEAFYLTDPEGNGIELYADRPEEAWPRGADGRLDMYTRRLDIDSLVSSPGVPASDEATADPWRLPDAADMGHVHLQVNDIDAARRFYVDQLGLDLVMSYASSALFVSTNGYHHHLGLNSWQSHGAEPRPEGALGLVEARFTVGADAAGPEENPSRRFVAWLGTRGIVDESDDDRSVALRDPAGNRLRFMIESSGTGRRVALGQPGDESGAT